MTIGEDRPAAHAVPPHPAPDAWYPAPNTAYPAPYPLPDPTDVPALAVPAEVTWSRWIWLVGTGVTVEGAAGYLAVVGADLVSEVVLVATLLLAAIAVPAALWVRSGARWARTVLVVCAALTVGSIYRVILNGFWVALVVDIPLAATYFLLRTPASKAFFAAAHDRRT